MTDSTNEKPTSRQNRLSPQNENFDFELADIKITPEQVDLIPSPLDSFVGDNETIDSERVDADAQQPSINKAVPQSYIANAAAPIIRPAPVVSEIKTNFYVDYFDSRKKSTATSPEPVSVAKTSQSTVDDRSQDAMIPEKNSTTPTEPDVTDDFYSEPLDNQAPVIDGAGMAVAVLSQFKSKQERINKQQEELIQAFSDKMKSATTVTYTAVFFGVIALVAATTIGVMLLKTKSDVSDLTGTTTAIKDDIKNIAKAAPDDLEGTDPSLDQLNQKVDDVIEQLNEVTALQNKVALLEKKVVTPKLSTTTKTLDNVPPTVDVVEKKPAAEHTVKAVPATKAVKNASAEQGITATTKPENNAKTTNKTVKSPTTEQGITVVDMPATKPESSSKTANKVGLYAPKKVSEIPDKAAQAVPANDINNVINNARPQAATPLPATTNTNTTTNNTASQANTGWAVNLASSNKLEDAKSTAARFAQKGVPVSISSVTVKNETRYRLQVKGFKTKDEAAAYANKAKDTLKLNSVWVQNP